MQAVAPPESDPRGAMLKVALDPPELALQTPDFVLLLRA